MLDVVPTGEVWARADAPLALGYWHWAFLAQPAPLPERLIGGDPDAFFDLHVRALGLGRAPDRYPAELMAAYRRAARRPGTVEAMCEDYRAGADIDREHDDADRGERRIDCPLLALWSARGALPRFYGDVLEVWRPWARESAAAASTPATSSSRTARRRSPTSSPPCSRPRRPDHRRTDHVLTPHELPRDDLAGKLKRTELQHVSSSIPGREIVQVLTEIPAGVESGWHQHPGEEVGYILAGTVRMEIEGPSHAHAARRHRFLIPPRTPHNALDLGPDTGRMLSTYLVEVGEPIAVFTRP